MLSLVVVTITCNFIAAGKTKMGGRLLKIILLPCPLPLVLLYPCRIKLLKFLTDAVWKENIFSWNKRSLILSVMLLFVLSCLGRQIFPGHFTHWGWWSLYLFQQSTGCACRRWDVVGVGFFLVVFSCFGGFCFVFKHEGEVLGFPFWWAIILSFQFAFTNLLCLIPCLVLLCPTSSWKSWSWKGNSCWALGAEALQTWEVGGGFFPIGHVQNLHRLALLNRRDAGCFLPFLSLLNMRLERLAIPEVLWVPSSGGEGKYSSQSLLLELMYSSFLPF